MAMEKRHTCMLCEAVCGLSVELEGELATGVRGDVADVFSKGHICPKAAAIPDVMNDPDRIRQPMRRVGGRWEPLSWKEAFEEAGTRLAAVQQRHGRHSLGYYAGNPTVHSSSATLASVVFSRAIGTRSRFSATSVDQLPQMLAALTMLGHQLLMPVPDVDRTDFFLVLGANPLASNGSLMTSGGIGRRLKALQARGGKLVVVDPRRTETAAVADQHLALRPGGDAALLLAMLQVLFAEGLVRPGRLAGFTDGLERLEALAGPFTPERVAPAIGLPADVIRALARDFSGAPSAVAYCRVGASTQEFGGLASWLAVALNVVTGNLDRRGGAMFTTPAADLVALTARMGGQGSFGRWKSRVRGLPEFGGELPAAALAEELDTPGDGQIRALITHAGNPVLSTPNGRRLDRALAGLDYMVSIDLYRNETTRHANLILPTGFGFERDHFDAVFYLLSVRNVARAVRALVPPPPGTKADWQVLVELARALRAHGGGRRGLATSFGLGTMRWVGPRRLLDGLLRLGPRRTSLAALERMPHGADYGPLEPRLPERLYTPGRRIALVPELYVNDLSRLEAWLANGDRPLTLIGRRTLRSNNSWLHNSERLVKGPASCTLLLHPDDARARGLVDGARVRLSSRSGEVEARLAVTDEVSVGVACLPHGYGHDREGARLSVAVAHAGVSLNDVTDELRIDALTGVAAFSGTPVTVSEHPLD
jgi:anaerobic selenocysteine-containing dehydrogenase